MNDTTRAMADAEYAPAGPLAREDRDNAGAISRDAIGRCKDAMSMGEWQEALAWSQIAEIHDRIAKGPLP